MAEKIKRTGYVSEIDQFLRDFDKNRAQFPDSRLKEIEKHKKIFAKRDGVVDETKDLIWKDF
ncbi:MAG: hypothetical protein BGO43_01995 [Gammaproteobacteria bacterium 39-13]|nr:hypothetical protein [Gammaproteobacteria bacterium]OJV91853.1 MAG: hypothetical protein BGO43_01995 [Gammaproteobacteria bacterium 39-13]